MTVPDGFLPEVGTDPAEDLIGPFYLRRDAGDFAARLQVQQRHCNSMGNVHGGVLMTFADFALCAQARFGTDDDHIVTVSLNADFIDSAPADAWLQSRGEVVRRTRSLAFVQGQILHEGRPVLAYSGIGKRWQNR
ncbi:MAG: PaaI family thioesterase [Pseudomonadales bacterium]